MVALVLKQLGNKSVKNSSFKLVSRFYHPASKEYVTPETLEPLTYTKTSPEFRALAHTMEHSVPIHGFTEKAIINSLNTLKMPAAMVSTLGAANSATFLHSSPAVMELIKFQLVEKRHRLVEGIDAIAEATRLPALSDLLVKRLKMDIPIAAHLNQMTAQLMVPSAFMTNVSIPELEKLADDMIYYSNEEDHHDFAWYTKRAALATTYLASKAFMAQDSSPNFNQTMEFALDKLHNVMKLGDYYNNMEEFAWFTMMSGVNLAKSQLVKG
ncbi:ubiquinone biosynthesis protein COQ9 [Nakaseomyces bracarensis]|uniref:ubiquinone biosynthesis protein COQ9 n=1 Tax=Nakaseomyces bracarensis TaxID=273131 RepID=UPI0038726883